MLSPSTLHKNHGNNCDQKYDSCYTIAIPKGGDSRFLPQRLLDEFHGEGFRIGMCGREHTGGDVVEVVGEDGGGGADAADQAGGSGGCAMGEHDGDECAADGSTQLTHQGVEARAEADGL